MKKKKLIKKNKLIKNRKEKRTISIWPMQYINWDMSVGGSFQHRLTKDL